MSDVVVNTRARRKIKMFGVIFKEWQKQTGYTVSEGGILRNYKFIMLESHARMSINFSDKKLKKCTTRDKQLNVLIKYYIFKKKTFLCL